MVKCSKAWSAAIGQTDEGDTGGNLSPDIIGCKDGQMICIECKLPGNRPTETQEAWLKRAFDAGALRLVAYSISDVEKHV